MVLPVDSSVVEHQNSHRSSAPADLETPRDAREIITVDEGAHEQDYTGDSKPVEPFDCVFDCIIDVFTDSDASVECYDDRPGCHCRRDDE